MFSAVVVGAILIVCATTLSRGHERFHRPPLVEYAIAPTPASQECIATRGPCGGDLVLGADHIRRIMPADVDGDGQQDLVIETEDGRRTIQWQGLLNRESGWEFRSLAALPTDADDNPYPPVDESIPSTDFRSDTAAGDVDGDGDADLVRIARVTVPCTGRSCGVPPGTAAVVGPAGQTATAPARTTPSMVPVMPRTRNALTVLRNDGTTWRRLPTRWLDQPSDGATSSASGAPQVAISPSGGVVAAQWRVVLPQNSISRLQMFTARGPSLVPLTRAVASPPGLLALADIDDNGLADAVNIVSSVERGSKRPRLRNSIWTARRTGSTLAGASIPDGLRPDIIRINSITSWLDIDGDGFRDRSIGGCNWHSAHPTSCIGGAVAEPHDPFMELAPVAPSSSALRLGTSFLASTIYTRDRDYEYRWEIGSTSRAALSTTDVMDFTPRSHPTPLVTDLNGDGSSELIATGDGILRAWSLDSQGRAKRFRFEAAS